MATSFTLLAFALPNLVEFSLLILIPCSALKTKMI
jgi:hypothetical protein